MKKTTVLHITNNDVSGGAARAVMRLHSALQASNMDSKLLLLNKESDLGSALAYYSSRFSVLSKLRSFLDRLPSIFYFRSNHPSKFSFAWLPDRLIKRINKINPDIVHIHWINNGQMSLATLGKIKQPVVLTMLDMWPITGGCHYDYGCQGYTRLCGACPVLGSNWKRDFSSYQLKKKKNIFSNKNIMLIAISNWLKNCADESYSVLGNVVKVIPPALDTKIYRPLNKANCREIFGLPQKKFLILFGAMNATWDPRKGVSELSSALQILVSRLGSKEIEAVVFGASHGEIDVEIPVHYMGRLTSGFGMHDDASLAALYSSADVTITPSLQEAFGQTASESLACGTPVVAFKSTGVEDIVDHLVNGYLAKIGDAACLAEGIIWAFEKLGDETINLAARKKAVTHYDYNIIAKSYSDVYKKVLGRKF
jgi:glycosyltransferase involved in cell wall biosynthesis